MPEPVYGLRMAGRLEGSRLIRPGTEAGPSFVEFLQEALGRVNRLQVEAEQAAGELVSGDISSLHQLMIKSEEARLALQLTVQVTSKVVEAYQELSRMQI